MPTQRARVIARTLFVALSLISFLSVPGIAGAGLGGVFAFIAARGGRRYEHAS